MYKHNHFVPVGLLKNWRCESDNKTGKPWVWLFRHGNDAAEKHWSTDPPYDFASQAYLHSEVFEKVLGLYEDSLVKLVKHLQDEKRPLGPKEFERAVRALVSLQHRSRSTLNEVTASVDKLLGVRTELDPTSATVQSAVENNLERLIQKDVDAFRPSTLVVLRMTEKRLCISDQPSIEFPAPIEGLCPEGTRMIVLAPRVAVLLFKAQAKHDEGQALIREPEDQLSEVLNAMLVDQSTEWVVAPSEETLDRAIARRREVAQVPRTAVVTNVRSKVLMLLGHPAILQVFEQEGATEMQLTVLRGAPLDDMYVAAAPHVAFMMLSLGALRIPDKRTGLIASPDEFEARRAVIIGK